jgi:hypothetical protein
MIIQASFSIIKLYAGIHGIGHHRSDPGNLFGGLTDDMVRTFEPLKWEDDEWSPLGFAETDSAENQIN